MSDDIVKNFATPKHFCSIRLQGGGGGTFLTITKDGKIVLGEGLSQDEATQAAAKMLAEHFSALHQSQAAEITRLRAAIDNALLEPWLDGQLNGTWHQEPIGQNETPEEAVKRLVSVRAEWAVYKNDCENPVIAELRAACDASEERARAIELQFWQTVDRDGLTGLPSDMWAALEQLVQDRAALATAQVDAFKKAAEIARRFAQSEGWSGTSAMRLRNCIIAEAAIYTKTGEKNE